MSGFADTWLALREPVDARARDAALARELAGALAARAATRVLDLGAGTGANFRSLAPLLGHGQHWTLVDHDTTLLEGVDARLAAWADAHALRFDTGAEGHARVVGEAFDATIERRRLDLATRLDALPFAAQALVTGSALLDLAGERWLDTLAARCAAHGCIVHFAMSYDGRTHWSPVLTDDGMVNELFNRHQRRDKGLGPALGPDAASHLAARLGRHGFTLGTATSDWRLGASDNALQRELLAGIVAALGQLEPERAPRIRAWHDARRALIDAGRSRMLVGHVDLLALPR